MESLLIGIVSGVVASIVFWGGQYLLRPRIKKADIAVMNGKISIKVKNCTWLRPVIDVEAGLFHVTHPVAPDGNCYADHKEIPLKHQRTFVMLKCDDEKRNGARIFVSKNDVDIKLAHKDYIRLCVAASDGWFNLRRVFIFDYFQKDIVTEPAKYESGRSLEIKYV